MFQEFSYDEFIEYYINSKDIEYNTLLDKKICFDDKIEDILRYAPMDVVNFMFINMRDPDKILRVTEKNWDCDIYRRKQLITFLVNKGISLPKKDININYEKIDMEYKLMEISYEINTMETQIKQLRQEAGKLKQEKNRLKQLLK